MSDCPKWISIDPRNNAKVPYDTATNAMLERAFQAKEAHCDVYLGGVSFRVTFSDMRQHNGTGGSRQVKRSGPAPPPVPEAPVVLPDPLLLYAVVQSASVMDQAVADANHRIADRTAHVPTTPPGSPQVLALYDCMLCELRKRCYVEKYGGCDEDVTMTKQPQGQQVQNYYANVADDGSIYRRKVLSVLGLRNLVVHGAAIFNELKDKLFSGDPGAYSGQTGLGKMRHYTGNTVDLDTVLLNANVQLRAINVMLKAEGKPTFQSGDALAKSDFARDYVYNAATPLLNDFIEKLKLTEAEAKRRCVFVDSASRGTIHVATGNSDRGKQPVWHYNNVGVSTFHCNVPTLPDVFGALLLAPFHGAKAFALVIEKNKSTPEKLASAFDSFFEDCISDSCFNGKWKSIEQFLEKVEEVITIPQMLSRLQANNTDVFTQAFLDADPDHSKEREEMLKIVQKQQAVALDPTTKKKRPITAADVDSWMKTCLGE